MWSTLSKAPGMWKPSPFGESVNSRPDFTSSQLRHFLLEKVYSILLRYPYTRSEPSAGSTSGNSTLPIRCKASITFWRLNLSCSGYEMCCQRQPPQVPKCVQRGSVRMSDFLRKRTMCASAKACFLRSTCTSTTSPGAAYGTKITSSRSLCAESRRRPSAFPSAATAVISSPSRRGNGFFFLPMGNSIKKEALRKGGTFRRTKLSKICETAKPYALTFALSEYQAGCDRRVSRAGHFTGRMLMANPPPGTVLSFRRVLLSTFFLLMV